MQTTVLDLRDEDLRAALGAGWGFVSLSLTYLPVGFGGHHWRADRDSGAPLFVTVDDLSAPSRGGLEPDGAFARLAGAYGVAAALFESGLKAVVPPLRAVDGAVLLRIGQRYALSTQWWVDGRSKPFGTARTVPERHAVAALLGRLHGATDHLLASGTAIPERDDLGLQARAALEAALCDLDQPWRGGPFGEPARRLVRHHRKLLMQRLRAFDRHARRLAEDARPWVVTHGEPHPGNVLDSGGGSLHLVDWDTVLLAPPERDLHMILDGGASDDGVLRTYLDASPVPSVDTEVLSLYRERWSLTDVATAVAALRTDHEETDDARTALRSLRSGLRG